MEIDDLKFQNLTTKHLKPYEKRASTESLQFLRWILENIFRQDSQEADDACVDQKQDKGVDGILVNDVLELVYIFQSKIKQKDKATLGDTELKEFVGTLTQFKSPETVQGLLDGKANDVLKAALLRNDIKTKIEGGYTIEGIFCTNAPLNSEGAAYLKTTEDVTVYDAKRICAEFIDLDALSGIDEAFSFDTSDTEVIKYHTAQGVTARIFLANALQMTHMTGIADGTLFSQNVRLSLGNTKVNKSLIASIRDKNEHKNFPLYHNGITVLCESMDEAKKEKITISKYMVVNGAQSLSSLMQEKSKITQDLKILVKIVALDGNIELTEKVTQNSNNQNAIKPRDMRSNHGIQQRLKKEVAALNYNGFVLEVKRGEVSKGKRPISNEDAGLALLALDLGEPWNCHQKYKVMDESHSKIFGRVDVTGAKIVALYSALQSVEASLNDFDDGLFGHYTLTRYFLAHVVSEIIKEDPIGKKVFADFGSIIKAKKLDAFLEVFADLSATAVDDLNAEIVDIVDGIGFDYKKDLKSPKWCRTMCQKMKSAYSKDVKRKKAKPVSELLSFALK
ncbi:MAG: AIPR family protein [Alphaproteobacteria bacterium]|nr:AIPR family protein [Alphaproteobacteria bacterium]